MSELETRLKTLIVSGLHHDGVDPASIDSDAPLFGDHDKLGGLGLDSIDALELGIVLKKEFGLEVAVADPEIRDHFRSVRSLAGLLMRQGLAA